MEHRVTPVQRLRWLTPDWPAPARVCALSTLRGGGVSEGVYASLNLGDHVGDAAAAVAENRRLLRAAARLPGEPEWLTQVHGICVRDLDAPGPAGMADTSVMGRPVEHPDAIITAPSAVPADAAITRQPGRVCAILTADCLPVLLAVDTRRARAGAAVGAGGAGAAVGTGAAGAVGTGRAGAAVGVGRAGAAVGAVHAGWRGLAAGVIEATVSALGAPPGDLLAWLGPAIGPRHFEVGAEVRDALLRDDPGAGAAFEPNVRGRFMADLYTLARRRLARLGVDHIYGGGECTYTDRDTYFSHRRDGQTGRQATLIWLEQR